MEKQKRIITDMEEDLFFKFKAKVANNHKTIKEVVTELIKQYIKEN